MTGSSLSLLHLLRRSSSLISGMTSYQGLEEMKDVRVLWLHHNLIDKCEGLSHLSNLRILYLQSNRISSLRGLEGEQGKSLPLLSASPSR